MSDLELDPTLLETLRTLALHDVEFVLVGDVAEAIHDDGGFVSGVSIVPGSYGRNARRLATALHAMDAQPSVAGAPAAEPLDPRTDLRELSPCSFVTRHVDVDVCFQPPGTGGYRDLFDDAAHVELAPGVRPLVASPDDLERMSRGGAAAAPYATPPAALPPEPAPGWTLGRDTRAGRATRI